MPIWNFDGSSTGQAPGENSDVYLRPCAVYPDPFRRGDNIMYALRGFLDDHRPVLTPATAS